MVTGGATGLGRAIALEFGRQGCHVAFCFVDLPGRDVTEQALLTETTLRAMGVQVYAAKCDVRDAAAVERFMERGADRTGRPPHPGQQRRHRDGRRALADDRPGLEGSARDQRHGHLPVHPRRVAGVPGAAVRQDRERERPPGGAARVRRGQLRGEQGGGHRPHPRRGGGARSVERERQRGRPRVHPDRADGDAARRRDRAGQEALASWAGWPSRPTWPRSSPSSVPTTPAT